MNRTQERLEDILNQIERGRQRELVNRAAAFARRVHAAQERNDGATVYDHVLGVAENMLQAGYSEGSLIAAGLLHDVLEKTPLTLNDLERDFGTRVSHTRRCGDQSPGR